MHQKAFCLSLQGPWLLEFQQRRILFLCTVNLEDLEIFTMNIGTFTLHYHFLEWQL